MEWFKRRYPDMRVHAVNFPGDPYPIHIDATFVPLRPGLIITNLHRRLPEEQRKIFESNDWEIIDAAQPGTRHPAAAVLLLGWLSMNYLVLDPKTVAVEASEVHQMEQMDKLGTNVIPVPLRDAYAFGGGMHCATRTCTAKAAWRTTSRTRSPTRRWSDPVRRWGLHAHRPGSSPTPGDHRDCSSNPISGSRWESLKMNNAWVSRDDRLRTEWPGRPVVARAVPTHVVDGETGLVRPGDF